MIKLMAFDLDGTLLTDEKKITLGTIDGIKRARQMGIVMVPATGRPLAGVPPEVLTFAQAAYAITSNGARIVRLSDGETVYEKLMDKEQAWEILQGLGKYDVLQEIYFDSRGYVPADQYVNVAKYHKIPQMREYFVKTRSPVEDLGAFVAKQTSKVDKIQVLFSDMQERQKAWDEVAQIDGIAPVGSLLYNIEINAAGVDKGNALLELSYRLGIRREETIAFGDGDNDVGLVKQAGIGVAMANAEPQVKAAADFVTASNNEDGILRAMEKYIFGRQL